VAQLPTGAVVGDSVGDVVGVVVGTTVVLAVDVPTLSQTISHVLPLTSCKPGPHTSGRLLFSADVASQQLPQLQPINSRYLHGSVCASLHVAPAHGLEQLPGDGLGDDAAMHVQAVLLVSS